MGPFGTKVNVFCAVFKPWCDAYCWRRLPIDISCPGTSHDWHIIPLSNFCTLMGRAIVWYSYLQLQLTHLNANMIKIIDAILRVIGNCAVTSKDIEVLSIGMTTVLLWLHLHIFPRIMRLCYWMCQFYNLEIDFLNIQVNIALKLMSDDLVNKSTAVRVTAWLRQAPRSPTPYGVTKQQCVHCYQRRTHQTVPSLKYNAYVIIEWSRPTNVI